MADPEQIYQEVLQEEQSKGSATAVAEGRAKAARVRAEHGSPHPKEPKWWPGAQPHLEGGDGAAPVEEVAEAPADEPAAEAPAEEPAAEAAPADEPAAEAAPADEPAAEAAPADEPAAEAPAEAPAEQPAAEAPAEQPAAAQQSAPTAADQPAAAAPAAVAAEPQPGHQQVTGVTHGVPTGTRLRPEDGVATEAQFEGQRAMYERRKLIDELIATGVPAAAAADAGRPRAPWLAILYLIIPLIVVGFILANYGDAETTAGETGGEEQTGGETGGGGGGTTLVAQSLQFDTDTLELDAGKPTEVTLDNRDSQVHNVAFFESEADADDPGNALFTSPDADPGATETFEVDPLDKGEYYFHCDYHPQMNGTATAQ